MFKIKHLFYCLIFFFAASNVFGQNGAALNNIQEAIKIGSSRELAKYLSNNVEINFDNESSVYSQNQAEFVLKEFFMKYPPKDFQVSHQGSSSKGQLRYAIGKYICDDTSFVVLIRMKNIEGEYIVINLTFNKE
ncbi:DUF4783 domain-containing protein [Marinigracilibium pacificum]|uniref:DUF4783 domain-containing protein n=1 Tax=Marinigracilibium pacificum TaxID=2729599 RepID=A0A848IX02_9BACT|nr:DUF4783 domain-containing protein [Marinigracilibium pacificum]NMM46780.1 DUF4783 domain-containing protein [Marinigracilibium pacificum]